MLTGAVMTPAFNPSAIAPTTLAAIPQLVLPATLETVRRNVGKDLEAAAAAG